jgi:hypothetical protein
MVSKAIPCLAAVSTPPVSVIPLAMKIVCHINNVVNDFGDLFDRKPFEIPKGGRSRYANCLLFRESPANRLEKL